MNRSESIQNQNSDDIRHLLLGVAVLMAFVFVVSLSIYLIKEHYGLSCSCEISLPIVISILTSLGVFVGILTYYFFSKSFSQEKEKILGNVEHTLNFLDKDERTILLAIIENEGTIAQKTLAKRTGLDSVKLHRRLSSLENKNILHKDKKGMTNIIILNPEYITLFIQNKNQSPYD